MGVEIRTEVNPCNPFRFLLPSSRCRLNASDLQGNSSSPRSSWSTGVNATGIGYYIPEWLLKARGLTVDGFFSGARSQVGIGGARFENRVQGSFLRINLL